MSEVQQSREEWLRDRLIWTVRTAGRCEDRLEEFRKEVNAQKRGKAPQKKAALTALEDGQTRLSVAAAGCSCD